MIAGKIQQNYRRHKLRFKWFGLCYVPAVQGTLIYAATFLHCWKTQRAHLFRVIKIRDSLLGQLVPKDMLEFAETIEPGYEVA